MIRVVSAEAVAVTFRLAEGYRIAGLTLTSATNIVLKVDTSDGRTGFGCAAPAEHVTGESSEASLWALEDVLIPLLRESDAARISEVVARCAGAAPAAPAARAAVDIALHDLLGRRAGLPVAHLLGRKRTSLPTSVTLGISDDPGATVERARRWVADGFHVLKIKVGENWEADAALIKALKRELGPGILIRADGNQGYSEEEARLFLAAIEPEELELLEQPTSVADPQALDRLGKYSRIPIMADESIQTIADADRLATSGAVPLVNLKLMKSGGIHATMSMAGRADAGGLGAMMGCNDESRIGIAAALHCALAAPGLERADLDGHLDLENDVARGGVRIEDGHVLPFEEEPGLGVSVSL